MIPLATQLPSTPVPPPNMPLRGWLRTLEQNKVVRWHGAHSNFGALLAPLLEAVGWQGDVLALADVLPHKQDSLTLDDILAVMVTLGYRPQAEPMHTSAIDSTNLPGLFVLDRSNNGIAAWVVWEHGSHGFIWEDGARQHHGSLPAQHGTLYRFTRPEAGFDTGEEDVTAPHSWMSDLLGRFRSTLWHALGLSLVAHLFMLAMPVFSMVVYDRVIAAHAPGTLPLLAAGVLGALVAELVLRTMRTRLVGWLAARLDLLVTQAMFERLLFLPSALAEQASVAAQLARMRAFESVRDFVAGPLFQALLEVPFVIILLIAMAVLAVPVALVGVGVLALYALLLGLTAARWRRLSREVAHTAAQRQQMLQETAELARPLVAAGMGERTILRFKALAKHSRRVQHRHAMLAAMVQHGAALLTIGAGIVIINWCLARIWNGDMTGGAMVAVMIITWRMLYPLQTLCTVIPYAEQIQAAMQQVAQVMTLPVEAHSAAHTPGQRLLTGTVELQNLSLRYTRNGKPVGDPVFWGLNAHITPGQRVAVYGANGSGKSSVLRLILGLYTPALGSVRLDGVDSRQLDPRVLRRQIAYLPQRAEFVPGTIADNLRVVHPTASADELQAALERADAWNLVSTLPDGLETQLGQTFTPSTGLAMRLCLARLYLCARPIVLCDELPVQVLNSAAGENFRAWLQECRGQRTVIFVTHREDWLALADQVIWLRPGLLPAVGSPHDHNNKGANP